MKKFIYAFLFALATSFAFTACSEEEIAPSTELENGGGGGSVDGKN